MIDYLDIYTRLELCQYSDILITYYCIGGKKMNQKLMLEGIVDFEYVVVNTEGENFNIPFFGQSVMIESIKLDNSDKLLYYNPYVSKELYEGDYIDEENVEIIKEKVLGKKAFDSKDKEKFHRIRNHVCEYLVKHNFEYNDLFFSEKQKREFEEFFEVLIKGITNYCEKNGLDTELKFINKGSTSLIYGIGDKIIKIGKPRRQSNIPYCEYVLQPIINRDYFFDDYPIHVEVTQKVLVCEDNKNIFKDNKEFDEILRDLIEKLREIGLTCYDLNEWNIGILISDNKIHYDSIEFDTGNSDATSIESNNNLKVRGPGDYVIIDLDCLEIEDMEKYTNYLKSLGFPIEYNSYNHKK